MAQRSTSSSSNKANDKQVAGTHYSAVVGNCPHCGGEIQHWDLYAKAPYLIGQATKYITRAIFKNGRQDIDKGLHFIQKILEVYFPEK